MLRCLSITFTLTFKLTLNTQRKFGLNFRKSKIVQKHAMSDLTPTKKPVDANRVKYSLPQERPRSNSTLDERLEVSVGRSALTTLTPQAQFQNLRASVEGTLPAAAILALSPSHASGGGSFDSLDEKLDAAIDHAVSIPLPGHRRGSTKVSIDEPPLSITSPVAAMPYQVPKHHSRKVSQGEATR